MTENEKQALAQAILRGVEAAHRAKVAEARAEEAERRTGAAEKDAEFFRAENRILLQKIEILEAANEHLQGMLDDPDELLEWAREMEAEARADMWRDMGDYH